MTSCSRCLLRSPAQRPSARCRNRPPPAPPDRRTPHRRRRSAPAPSGRSCRGCRRRCGAGRSSRCRPGQPGPGHAVFGERADVGFRTALAGHVFDAQRRQRRCDLLRSQAWPRRRRARRSRRCGRRRNRFPPRSRAAPTSSACCLGVGLAAVQALLLVGERDHADRARRMPAAGRRSASPAAMVMPMPAASSIAPVPGSQESRWPPISTTSSRAACCR